MLVKSQRRITRCMTLRYFKKSGKITVEVERPYKRHWATRVYTPTTASLARVQHLVGYKLSPDGFWHVNGKVAVTEHIWRD